MEIYRCSSKQQEESYILPASPHSACWTDHKKGLRISVDIYIYLCLPETALFQEGERTGYAWPLI